MFSGQARARGFMLILCAVSVASVEWYLAPMMYMVVTRIRLNYCGLDKGVSSGSDECSCAGWTLGMVNGSVIE